jgi:hypothetical protein
MNKAKLNKSNLYSLIVGKLADNFGNLPKSGIIAGQAVASAVYDIVGLSTSGPYNDLDIYCEKPYSQDIDTSEFEGRPFSPPKVSTRMADKAGGDWSSSFDGIFEPLERMGYSVQHCSYDPENEKHNYIVIDYSDNTPTKDAVKVVVDAFDINCCKIGIDLDKKEVYWSPEFEQFLDHREIRIDNYCTAAHSLVRAIKKSKELDFASFDKDYYIDKIQTVRKFIESREHLRTAVGKSNYFSGHVFSTVYLKKIEQYAQEIYQHFSLDSKQVKFSNVGTSDFGQLTSREMFVLKPKEWDGNLLNSINVFFTITQSNWRDERFFTSLESNLSYIGDIINVTAPDCTKRDSFYRLMDICIQNDVSKLGSRFLFNVLFSDKGDVIELLSDDELVSCARMVNKTPGFGAMQHLNFKPEEFKNYMNNITALVSSPYTWLVDEVVMSFDKEHKSHTKSYETITRKNEWLARDNALSVAEKMHNDKMAALKENAIMPLFDEVMKSLDTSTISIKEMCSEGDLFELDSIASNGQYLWEGNYSYGWARVVDGTSHIFLISNTETPDRKVALELSFNDYFRVRDDLYFNKEKLSDQERSFVNNFIRACNDHVGSSTPGQPLSLLAKYTLNPCDRLDNVDENYKKHVLLCAKEVDFF